ncbi:major pilin protein FimA [Bacillaceae bacterium JMAK1]|nr:major pilin protein FimA [Bacillaceae bacterium JMAK1]
MNDHEVFMTTTFSVAARCEKTNSFGAIVTTSSPAVGARVIQCQSNTGIVLSQNMTDPRLARIGLNTLHDRFDASSALRAMKAATPYPEYRQLAVVDRNGNSDAFTGENAFGPHAGQHCAKNVAAVGNYLSNPDIPKAMAEQYIHKDQLSLPDRLLDAIEVGFKLGGEVKDEKSIALVVYTDTTFPYIDLRVDYSDDPLTSMKELWEVWRNHADTYRQKALNPNL